MGADPQGVIGSGVPAEALIRDPAKITSAFLPDRCIRTEQADSFVHESAHPRHGECCAPGQVDAGRTRATPIEPDVIATDNVASMTTMQYPSTSSRQRMTLGAGTAMKIGFFGAFGAFLFMLIVYAVIGLIAARARRHGLLRFSGESAAELTQSTGNPGRAVDVVLRARGETERRQQGGRRRHWPPRRSWPRP